MSSLCSVIKSLISKALVNSDLILIKPNLRVLEQFPVTGRSMEFMVDNLGIGTRYPLVVAGLGCLFIYTKFGACVVK